jgi:hypothetical protein
MFWRLIVVFSIACLDKYRSSRDLTTFLPLQNTWNAWHDQSKLPFSLALSTCDGTFRIPLHLCLTKKLRAKAEHLFKRCTGGWKVTSTSRLARALESMGWGAI